MKRMKKQELEEAEKCTTVKAVEDTLAQAPARQQTTGSQQRSHPQVTAPVVATWEEGYSEHARKD